MRKKAGYTFRNWKVTTADGSEIRRTGGACVCCGGYHEGVWGSVATAIHAVLWTVKRLSRR